MDFDRLRFVSERADASETLMSVEIPEKAGSFRRFISHIEPQRGQSAPPPPWQRPSSAPAPRQGTPGGSGQLGTPRKRPCHRAPRHCFGFSS